MEINFKLRDCPICRETRKQEHQARKAAADLTRQVRQVGKSQKGETK